jgi:hypothetical protein
MQNMSDHDALHDRGRALEEEYFRRKDRELIEKIRQKAVAEDSQRALGALTGVTDPEVLRELQSLGFTPDTIALLPLMPVLQVAWAEGGVTPVERHLIEKLANARGIAPGSGADAQLMDWLANRPSDAVFSGAARLIHALLESGSSLTSDLTADGLVDYCEQVASVSGGIFGLGRVSREERDLLASIARDLKGRKQV